MAKDDDKRRLEKTVSALQTRFGMRALRRLGQQEELLRIATGFDALDRILAGGLPRGRITEIGGAPTSGVVTLALMTIAQAQARGEMAVYVDLERTFDPHYAARCGVVLDQLLLVHPGSVRQAMSVLQEFVAGDVGLLVCDLHRRLQTPDSPTAQTLPGSLERLLAPLNKSATALIFLVSLSPDAGVTDTSKSARRLPSGHVSHYAAVRLLAQRKRWIHRRQDIRGCNVQVRVLKNKGGRAGAGVNVNVLFEDAREPGDARS